MYGIENPTSFIIKLIIFGLFMNFSFFLIDILLDLNSNISLAITLMPPFKRYSINHLFIAKSQVFRT